jgi:hypothetical protein
VGERQFKDWTGNGPAPYLPGERSFINGHVSVDYNLMMTNYHNDVCEALKTRDGLKLARYDKMVILNTSGEQVFPATDLKTIRNALDGDLEPPLSAGGSEPGASRSARPPLALLSTRPRNRFGRVARKRNFRTTPPRSGMS